MVPVRPRLTLAVLVAVTLKFKVNVRPSILNYLVMRIRVAVLAVAAGFAAAVVRTASAAMTIPVAARAVADAVRPGRA